MTLRVFVVGYPTLLALGTHEMMSEIDLRGVESWNEKQMTNAQQMMPRGRCPNRRPKKVDLHVHVRRFTCTVHDK